MLVGGTDVAVAVGGTGVSVGEISDTEVAVSDTEVAVSDSDTAVGSAAAPVGSDVAMTGSGSSAGTVNLACAISGSEGENTSRSSPPTIMATNTTMTRATIIRIEMAGGEAGVAGACQLDGGVAGGAGVVALDTVAKGAVLDGIGAPPHAACSSA